jgi:hypothetical protein
MNVDKDADPFGVAPLSTRVCPNCVRGDVVHGSLVDPCPDNIQGQISWCSKAVCKECRFEWHVCCLCPNIRQILDAQQIRKMDRNPNWLSTYNMMCLLDLPATILKSSDLYNSGMKASGWENDMYQRWRVKDWNVRWTISIASCCITCSMRNSRVRRANQDWILYHQDSRIHGWVTL